MMGTEVREGHRQAGCGVGRVVRSKRLSSLEYRSDPANKQSPWRGSPFISHLGCY